MRFLFLIVILSNISYFSFAQDSTFSLEAGIRCKKFTGFYWENGVTAEFNSEKIAHKKITFGLNIVSSKLGSAIHSNALTTLETELSAIYYFRFSKDFQPLVRLNAGMAHVNYGSPIFDDLQNNAPLLSLEVGLSYKLPANLRVAISGGYNVFTGNGSKGLGTVYPIFGQFSVFYKIK
ncbi:MAG: hypothetical protein LW701_07685 [Fluviicola sp.]|jgi:hypothetical protein|nr:hypothetical protein [Fluviicola sp.]